MKYFPLYFFISIALIGCGTNVPDCADDEILGIVKRLSTDMYRANVTAYVKGSSNSFMGVPIRKLGQAGMVWGWLVATIKEKHFNVTPIDIKHVTATLYDKELKKRVCTANIYFKTSLSEFPKGSEDYNIVKNIIVSIPESMPNSIKVEYSITPDLSKEGTHTVEVSVIR